MTALYKGSEKAKADTRERVRRWRKANAELNASRQRKYNLAFERKHPDKARSWHRASDQQRRAREANAVTERFTIEEIADRDQWICGICKQVVDPTVPAGRRRDGTKQPHPFSPSLDHIVPLCKGGSHTRENVQLSHLRCNLKKHAS